VYGSTRSNKHRGDIDRRHIGGILLSPSISVAQIDPAYTLAELNGLTPLRRGHDLQVCHVGRMMCAEAPDVPAGRILNLPITRRGRVRPPYIVSLRSGYFLTSDAAG
jgi:hypothetical protein